MQLTKIREIFDLIIVGRGTAAASYLRSLQALHSTPESDDLPESILVIGKPDPWAGARGYHDRYYSKNINQARALVDHGTGPRGTRSQDPVDRRGFALENEAIIDAVADRNVLDDEVTSITRVVKKGADVLKVQTTSWGAYHAHKVVLATGAGIETSDRNYHRLPSYIPKRLPGRIMNLDEFMCTPSIGAAKGNTTVAIIGPTAGTDAIMECATRQIPLANVWWLMKDKNQEGSALTWAAGGSYTPAEAKRLKSNGGAIVECNTRELTINSTGLKVVISHADGPSAGTEICAVDVVVYALGQGGGGHMRSVSAGANKTKLISFVDSALTDDLEPVYDIDQRYAVHSVDDEGKIVHEGGAWQHVLGLQLKGTTAKTGLEIVGSGALQSAQIGRIQHNYLDDAYSGLFAQGYKTLQPWIGKFGLRHFEVKRFTELLRVVGPADLAALKRERPRVITSAMNEFRKTAMKGMTGYYDYKLVEKKQRLLSDFYYTHVLRVAAATEMKATRSDVVSQLSAGLSRTLPAPVANGALIGGVQRNTEALTGSMRTARVLNPGGLNFLEDQTTIATHIAVHYENICEADANRFVTQLLRARRGKDRGFSRQEVAAFYRQLYFMNAG